MSTFRQRYLMLTREERLLIAGILLIIACGIAVRYVKYTRPPDPAPAAGLPATPDRP